MTPSTWAGDPPVLAHLVATDADIGDHFGYSVTSGGGYLLVGAYADDETASNAGAAYVFDSSDGTFLAKLTAGDATVNDLLGLEVALYGSLALVGAPRYDAGIPFGEVGAVYVFDLNTGLEVTKLFASDGVGSHGFGGTIVVDGNYALIGDSSHDGLGVDAGAVYVFNLTTGQEERILFADDAEAHDLFGGCIDLEGDLAVISAHGDDDQGMEAGAAYLFDISTGQQLYKLHGSDIATAHEFGISVALSGNTVLVGADRHSHNFIKSGSVYVFDATTGLEVAELLPPSPQVGLGYGKHMVAEGPLALIDVPGSLSVRLLDLNTFQEIGSLIPSDPNAVSDFGRDLAIDGDRLVVGQPTLGCGVGSEGSTYLYDYTPPVASATSRNGNGINQIRLTSLSNPVLGLSWDADLDANGHAPGVASIVAYSGPATGPTLPGGELLIDTTTPQIAVLTLPHQGASVSFSFPIPNDARLCGLAASAQGLILGAPGYELTNAIDLILGL